MYFDYFEVEPKIKELAKKVVTESGYEFVGIVKQSNNSLDYYLYLVVGIGKNYNSVDDSYIVWLFNSSLNKGEGYLCDGSYDLSFTEMLEELKNRVVEI